MAMMAPSTKIIIIKKQRNTEKLLTVFAFSENRYRFFLVTRSST
jgi:hypothetical protein